MVKDLHKVTDKYVTLAKLYVWEVSKKVFFFIWNYFGQIKYFMIDLLDKINKFS